MESFSTAGNRQHPELCIGMLTLWLHLEGCRSLKEKRQRIGGLRERFGKQPHLAVCESGTPDQHDKSEWTFVCAAAQRTLVERTLGDVEQHMAADIDAVIYDRQLEFL